MCEIPQIDRYLRSMLSRRAASEEYRFEAMVSTPLRLTIAAILLAAIAAVLASEQVEQLLSGYDRNLIILLLVIMTVFTLLGKGIFDIAVGAFKEGIIPIDRITVFVEDIQFELPTISAELLHREVSLSEIEKLKDKFSVLRESIVLNNEEAHKINQHSRGSFYLRDVLSNVPYNLLEIYTDFLSNPLYNGHRFSKYSAMTRTWSDFFARRKSDDSTKTIDNFMKSEASKAISEMGGISRELVTLAANREIDLNADLASPHNPEQTARVSLYEQHSTFNEQGVRTGHSASEIILVLRSQHIYLGENSAWLVKPINDYASLYINGNIARLADIFDEAGDIFERQSHRMAGYLDAWNSILADRQSSLFVLTATLSNLGRFDSFVRAKGKVVIGTSGAKAPIEFIVEQYGEDPTQLGRSQYISVESRKTKTVRFLARLEEDKRQSVRAAYESGLVYVRLALLVSSGKAEKKIVSPLSPFSVEARKQHDAAVAKMAISI